MDALERDMAAIDICTSEEDLDQKLRKISDDMKATNNETRLAAAREGRQMVSVKDPRPGLIDRLLKWDIPLQWVACLHEVENPDLQFESLWALTNIASGTSEHTSVVVNSGATPLAIRLIGSGDPRVREQALWLLGNIIGDGPAERDLCISSGIVEALLHLSNGWRSEPLSVIRNMAWVILNIIRRREPAVMPHVVSQLMPLVKDLTTSYDNEVVSDATWTLAHVADGPDIQLVLDADVVPMLVHNLNHRNQDVQTAALRAVGNIATGTDDQTQVVLDCGALGFTTWLLQHSIENVRKESMWFLSNVMAGSQSQIQQVLDACLLHQIAFALGNESGKVKIEAAWAIANATRGGTVEQVSRIANADVIGPLCDMLLTDDPGALQLALDCLSTIMNRLWNRLHVVLAMVRGRGVYHRIAELQRHERPLIQAKARNILLFFDVFEDSRFLILVCLFLVAVTVFIYSIVVVIS